MAILRRDDWLLRLANAAPFVCLFIILPARITYLINSSSLYGLPTPGIPLGVGLIMVLVALTTAVIAGRVPRRLVPWLLVGQAALTYLPCVFYSWAWGPIGGLLIYSMMALLPPSRRIWTLTALVALVEPVVRAQLFPGSDLNMILGTLVFDLNTGVWLFGLTRMRDLVRRAHAVREELVPLEVAGERLRAARDLRQALGDDLSAIVGLSRRAAEPGEIVAVARRALTGARRIADGFRSRTPQEELAAARSVLASAGVDVQVHGVPPEGTDPSFGTELRLIVMALLSGQVRGCRIEVDDTARLRVSWDGEADLSLGPGPVIERRFSVRPGEQEDPARVEVPRRFAWRMLALVVVCHIGMMYFNYVEQARYDPMPWAPLLAAAGTLVGALTLYHAAPRADEAAPRWWRWALGLQLAVVAAVFAFGGSYAITFVVTNLVGGAVLLRLRPRWSLPIFTVLGVLIVRNGYTSAVFGLYWVAALVNTSLSVYAFNLLPVLTRRLQQARAELARLAVVRERLRVARDVHDLLGFHLSAIALKGELAEHLPADRRAEQLADIAGIAEHALSDFRSITGEPAELSLATELEAARSLLTAAGVEVRTQLSASVPPAADRLLATVLREAITNVVRHADARVCEIELTGAIRLRVSNDGVRRESRTGGSGLANLTARTEEAGGTLQVLVQDGRFTLIAEV